MQEAWLKKIIENKKLMDMGHSQSAEDNNLGWGWVYYGLARAYRPRHVVCIGSYRGFVPMMFARGLKDNAQGGRVTFIDPSFVDGFWTKPEEVTAWFAEHDLDNITHHQMTTQDFVQSDAFAKLSPVDFLFVDGFHSEEQAEFDHMSFEDKLTPNSLALFHDSVTAKPSSIYGNDEPYSYSVYRYLQRLKEDPGYQVIDFPFADGVTLVRKVTPVGCPLQPERMYP